MDTITKEAIEYVRKLYQGNADGHGFSHTMRVWHTAMKIAETETGCDPELVSLTALLHDADDGKLFATENNANARSFLAVHGIPGETADYICRAVNSVSFSKNKGKTPDTPEGRIVQDADRLDAVGAIGIARTFAYGGAHGRTPEDSIAHFYEKLLLLKDIKKKKKAREIAEERHAFMEQFLREWDAEMFAGEQEA